MDKAEEKRQTIEEEKLNNEYTLKFTKRELMVIFHHLAVDEEGKPRKYTVGDGQVLFGVMTRVQPLVVVESSTPVNHVETPPLDLGKKVN